MASSQLSGSGAGIGLNSITLRWKRSGVSVGRIHFRALSSAGLPRSGSPHESRSAGEQGRLDEPASLRPRHGSSPKGE